MVGCVVRARTTSTAGAPRGRATQDTAAPDAPLRSILVGCCAIDSARSDMIRQLRIRSLCVARAGPAKRKGPSSSRALWAFVFIHILNANEPETRDRTYESTTLDGRARSIRCGRAASPHRARPRASDAPRAGRRPAGGGAVGSSRSTAIILRVPSGAILTPTRAPGRAATRPGSAIVQVPHQSAVVPAAFARARSCTRSPGAPHDGVPRSWLMRSHRPRWHSR